MSTAAALGSNGPLRRHFAFDLGQSAQQQTAIGVVAGAIEGPSIRRRCRALITEATLEIGTRRPVQVPTFDRSSLDLGEQVKAGAWTIDLGDGNGGLTRTMGVGHRFSNSAYSSAICCRSVSAYVGAEPWRQAMAA